MKESQPQQPSPAEIEDRVRTTYVEQLPTRLAQLKQLYVERSWPRLKVECDKLARGARKHGLGEVSALAARVALALPVAGTELVGYSMDDESRAALLALLEIRLEKTG